MAKLNRAPMIDDEGEVRELTADDFAWGVKVADFGGMAGVREFLRNRENILHEAEADGFDRDLFLAFEPNKPGFEERVERAISAFKNSGQIAAE